MSAVAPASLYATVLLAELVRLGVRDVIVCPGSRSQSLALAAAEAERAGAIRLHVRADERSAAFFALGVARETGVPAPVIVTSGTAVVNLLPAAYEADAGRVPFIALTADRPVEMRGIRSNQTTKQAHIFASIARCSEDIDVDAAMNGSAGTDRIAGPNVNGIPSSVGLINEDAVTSADSQLADGTTENFPNDLAERALRASLGRVGGRPAGPVQINLAFRDPLSGWDSETRVDFGLGEMTACELFTKVIEKATEDEVNTPEKTRTQHEGRKARFPSNDVTKAHDGPGIEHTEDGWKIQLGWEDTEIYEHSSDELAVVIAGADAGEAAEAFAHEAGLPLLAEVVSGSRYGREAITAYATLLDNPEIGGLVERAIVFGHPTLVRQIPALIGRDDVVTIVVDPHAGDGVDHYDAHRGAHIVRAARVSETHDPKSMRRWLGVWVRADRVLREERSTRHEPDLEAARATGYKERSAYARAETAVLREPITRALLTESVWRASWPHDRLVFAASRLVRELDALAPARRLVVHANRGLAGIDGTVATALGVAAASQASSDPTHAAGVTRVLIGDLALLHDAGSLLLPEMEARPRIQIFVGNDGGGTIFDTLEAAASAPADAFERTMYTPYDVDLAALSAAYGWEYRRLVNRGELSRYLTEPVEGPCLIEVPLSR